MICLIFWCESEEFCGGGGVTFGSMNGGFYYPVLGTVRVQV